MESVDLMRSEPGPRGPRYARLASGALLYSVELAPGQSRGFDWSVRLTGRDAASPKPIDAAKAQDATAALWRGKLDRVQLDVPEQGQHVVDTLRTAPNDGKAQALDELRALPCSVADTCSVQSACVAAYELHVSALHDIAASKRLVASPAASAAVASAALPALVLKAQESLERAKPLVQKCTDAQGELVRRFKLH